MNSFDPTLIECWVLLSYLITRLRSPPTHIHTELHHLTLKTITNGRIEKWTGQSALETKFVAHPSRRRSMAAACRQMVVYDGDQEPWSDDWKILTLCLPAVAANPNLYFLTDTNLTPKQPLTLPLQRREPQQQQPPPPQIQLQFGISDGSFPW